jgi:hypothetical protein
MTGRYMPHRRAYWPRWWPVALPAAVVTCVMVMLLNPPILLTVIASGAWGWLAMQGRLWIWKRRHPMVSVQELLEERRQAARWN